MLGKSVANTEHGNEDGHSTSNVASEKTDAMMNPSQIRKLAEVGCDE